MSKTRILGIEVSLEVEWIDLEAGAVGVICTVQRDGRGSTTRPILGIPANVAQRIREDLGVRRGVPGSEEQKCTWTYCPEQYGPSDYWETECGNAFQLASGTPTENDFQFCPYCGKRLEEKNE